MAAGDTEDDVVMEHLWAVRLQVVSVVILAVDHQVASVVRQEDSAAEALVEAAHQVAEAPVEVFNTTIEYMQKAHVGIRQ